MFSWTQARIVLPAWYGLGTALAAAREEHGLELLQEMERDWPFFAGAALQRRDGVREGRPRRSPPLRRSWCDDEELRERIWSAIEAEFERTLRELLRGHRRERLLDREPVLQRSIDRRNPYVDPLSSSRSSCCAAPRGGRRRDEELARASLLAINGIAGGLRNTG